MRPASLPILLDRESKTPVFEQIAIALRERIVAGALEAGVLLPPTRVLAADVGASRSTVVNAYDQLVAEGYIEGRQGAGFVVCDVGALAMPTHPPAEVAAPAKPITTRTFRPGEPDMRLFPHRTWGKAVARLCRRAPEEMLGRTPRFGHEGLRLAIAQHVADWRGLTVDPAQIIVTAGASDALELCLRSLCEVGDAVALEDPGYRPLTQFVRSQHLTPVYLRSDAQGASLPNAAKVAVLTPSQQFPLGGSMSPQRRAGFVQWAQSGDRWIIEDDYDSEFRYAGRPIPAMAGMDGLSRTIYIGSFSKIFANGLRLGYAIVPASLLDQVAATQRRFGARASLMPQAPLAEFMQTGEFYRHLRRVRRVYGQRRVILTDALRSDFADVGHFVDHQAGMQIAFHLNKEYQDTDIATRAREHGLEIEALSDFCLGQARYNGLLLGFCGFDEIELSDGLARLRAVLDASIRSL